MVEIKGPTLTVSPLWDKSPRVMIAAGGYDGVVEEFTDGSYKIQPCEADDDMPATLKVTLVHFGRIMTSVEVGKEFDRLGYTHAPPESLFALGAEYPDIQRDSRVITLHQRSVWSRPRGSDQVPVLGGDARQREAFLLWCDIGWGGGSRFLAVGM